MWLETGQKVQSVQAQMGNIFMQAWSKSESPDDITVFFLPTTVAEKVEKLIILIWAKSDNNPPRHGTSVGYSAVNIFIQQYFFL